MEVQNYATTSHRVGFSHDFPPQFGVSDPPFKGFPPVRRVHYYTRDFPPGCGPNPSKSCPILSEKLSGFGTWRRPVGAVRSKLPQIVKGTEPGFEPGCGRSLGEREKVVENCVLGKLQKNSKEREKVREMVRLFRKRCKELSMSGKGVKRVDLTACAELGREGKIVNQASLMIGAVPGVKVGDKFHYRVELKFVGLHKHYERGIDTMEWKGGKIATCIVASERHLDKMCDPNVLVYVGEGGVIKRNEVGKVKPDDQELKGGNLALWTNMKEKQPVRVVRGLLLDRGYGQKILYVYDGLYEVRAYEKKKGPLGNMIYQFQLSRCPGQPAVLWQECRRYQF